MIKGVTKSIIEIIPKNSDFEKVIVILNNSCDPPSKQELKHQIDLMTNSTPDYISRHKRSAALKMLLSGAAGALATAVSFLIIYTFV